MKRQHPFPNVSLLDRVLRLAVGSAMLSLVVVGPETPWGFLGLVPFVSALTGFSLIYRVFGVSTCSHGAKGPINAC